MQNISHSIEENSTDNCVFTNNKEENGNVEELEKDWLKEKRQINIPSFVKKIDDENLQKIVYGMASGLTQVYTQVEDENSNIVSFKRVCLKEEKDELLSQMYTDLKMKLQTLKKCYRHCDLINALKKRNEIKKLRQKIEELKAIQTYVMFSTGLEVSKTKVKILEIDIEQTARDIKPYKNIM